MHRIEACAGACSRGEDRNDDGQTDFDDLIELMEERLDCGSN